MNCFLKFIAALLIIFIFGCGGGTAGTDNGIIIRLHGQLQATDGSSDVSNLQIKVAESGETTTSRPDGTFDLTATNIAGDITLELSRNDFSASVLLPEATDEVDATGTVPVTLAINFVTATVELVGYQITAAPGNTPNPSDPTTPPTRGTVQGILRSAETGRPLEAAVVRIRGGTRTHTDSSGSFKLPFGPVTRSFVIIVVVDRQSFGVTVPPANAAPLPGGRVTITVELNLRLISDGSSGTASNSLAIGNYKQK